MNFSFPNNKNFLSFSDFELKLLGLIPGKIFSSVVKTAFCLLSTAFWGMIMLLERNCSYAFHILRTLRKNFGCLTKQFGHVRRNITLRFQSNIFRKHRFFEKTKLFTIPGFWMMFFGLWQKFFGRKILAVFSRLQSVFPRERIQISLQSLFIILGFWVKFLLTFSETFTAGLLKLHFFSEKLFEVFNFENIKPVSKVVDSDRNFLLFWREFSRSIVYTAF